mgnify:CR=1 FL=1
MFFWHRRPKYKNEVGELLAGDFYMMVLPDEDPFPTEEVTVRSYDGDGYRCRRIPYPAEGFHTKACLAALRRRQCVALRLEGVGHVVLTNFRDFRLFLMLQRAHRRGVNYVFCAGGGGGYFKILAGGSSARLRALSRSAITAATPRHAASPAHMSWRRGMSTASTPMRRPCGRWCRTSATARLWLCSTITSACGTFRTKI